MPEQRSLPLFRWGEDLRRHRIARRAGKRRLVLAAVSAASATAMAITLLWPPRPLLVWNATASSTIGLYAVVPAGAVGAGDVVIAWPPAKVRALAAERHYLPTGVPLVKRVGASPGDRVCAAGEALFVNGAQAALRRAADAAGRPLPWWTGCVRLHAGELLLLAPAPDSFDGRYFGPTRNGDVIGRATLLWAR